MIDVGSQFAKKISTIMIVENLTLKQFSQRVDIPYNRCRLRIWRYVFNVLL
jgi:predicted transcriptional regulator